MASTRTVESHTYFLKYFTEELKQLKISLEDFEVVNPDCCFMRNIPNRGVLKALIIGFDLHTKHALFGKPLSEHHRYDLTYMIRVDAEKIPEIYASLETQGYDAFQKKLVELILKYSNDDANAMLAEAKKGISENNKDMLGKIDHVTTQLPIKSMQDVLTVNSLLKEIFVELKNLINLKSPYTDYIRDNSSPKIHKWMTQNTSRQQAEIANSTTSDAQPSATKPSF